MIHEVNKNILQLDLSKYILTFDDGLYSQFFYWNLIKEIDTPKIFFIPTGAILLEDHCRPQFSGEFLEFPTCYTAMQKWFDDNNREDYMTLGELKKMIEQGAVIGAHGHMHLKEYDSCFIHRLEQFRKDNQDMSNWFKNVLKYSPKDYCFPFNKEYPVQRAVVNVEMDIFNFYGKERKDVAGLL